MLKKTIFFFSDLFLLVISMNLRKWLYLSPLASNQRNKYILLSSSSRSKESKFADNGPIICIRYKIKLSCPRLVWQFYIEFQELQFISLQNRSTGFLASSLNIVNEMFISIFCIRRHLSSGI